MKIAIFTETYPPYINGVATQTKILKDTYEKLGHEVMVITVGSEKQTKIEFKDNVVYVPGIMLKKIYNYRIALPIHFSRIKIAKEFKPDVVHIQNEFAIGATGLRVAEKLNIPAIYTLHTEYDRFLFYVGLKYFEEFSKKISDKYFRKFYKKADVVTSPSPKAQCYMDRQGINKKVVVIDNAVEFENFRETEETKNFRVKFREKYNLNDDAKAFVFVGRIGDEKNIKELINNWIKSDFPEEKAKLFIIGNGPQFEEIQKQIIKNNFENKIILVGSVPNTEISKYLHAMDYYTTASLSEMHSISMLEAMACGLPAIIKLDKPNKDQIKKGINGYQWDSYEDFNKIFNKILSLSNEEAEKLKQNVLKYSIENDHLNQAKILLDIYQKAIEKKRKENK
ncbi:glycosyltransferase [Helcococcus ovis]|uniref:Glycosyltransferase family 4 protein n=2 Tax=Bacteria TaxID=2 RepID=A0A4V3IYG9_9FIRM|nr:glycosyltransferase [Helcococcus ovis]TFF65620.1 glycosyltransferase family 4 protein [Helcococcus ovis]TFF67502.1 glycosyltransferase family 4 protein [Helcococcus ovis]